MSNTYPLNKGRKLNVRKTFRGRHGGLLNVLCTLNLRPVSRGILISFKRLKKSKIFRGKVRNIRNKTTGNILQTKEETAMIYWKTNLIKDVSY